MKFDVGLLYTQLSNKRQFRGNRCRDCHNLLKKKRISTCTFRVSGPISMKFVVEDIHIMPSCNCEFRENRCSDSLKGVNKILSVLSTFLSDLDKIWYTRCPKKKLSRHYEFCKSHNLLTGVNKFLSLFSTFIILFEFRYTRSAHIALKLLYCVMLN